MMFFEKDYISFHILDVIALHQENVNTFNMRRNFNALSFRFDSNAILKTGTKEHHITSNCVSFVPARLDYGRIATKDDMIVVHFDTTNYNIGEIEFFVAQDPENLGGMFRRILEYWESKEKGYKYRCSAVFYEILTECYLQNFREESKPSKIQGSVNYISENYTRTDLSMSEIAKKSFMSEVYFRQIFKKEYGTSPQKYIINLRIQHAAGLIATGYYSLQEVALMSGYSDYKYFSVEFKKIQGISPSKYMYHFSS